MPPDGKLVPEDGKNLPIKGGEESREKGGNPVPFPLLSFWRSRKRRRISG